MLTTFITFFQTGSLSHEFGHTIGLAHSQKRVDRDSYLNYFPDNVADAWRSQFDKDSIVYFTDWGVPFYYDSIMQYFPYVILLALKNVKLYLTQISLGSYCKHINDSLPVGSIDGSVDGSAGRTSVWRFVFD